MRRDEGRNFTQAPPFGLSKVTARIEAAAMPASGIPAIEVRLIEIAAEYLNSASLLEAAVNAPIPGGARLQILLRVVPDEEPSEKPTTSPLFRTEN